MFWADKIADEVVRRYQHVIDVGDPIIIRDEKTASGHVHVGSLRSASLHAIVADILTERGISNQFFFEINDFDPMDGIPSYLDERTYSQYMGMPLNRIPSPVEGYENFAELYGQEYIEVLNTVGFNAQVYRASELYTSGAMNEVIRKALERRDKIADIFERISGNLPSADWSPINVICEKCGKISTTKVTDFDGQTVAYTCVPNKVEWAEGCGHEGRISPFDGNAKFPWKLDWAAKFVVKGVHFEGGGKDHYTKGGARDVSEAICREVFDHEPPYGVFNEFFLVGGKKMSSSKGNAATAKDMSELLPPHILRLLLLRSPINRQLDFDPEGDAIPVLFDTYDRFAQKYWSSEEGDDSTVFYYSHLPSERKNITERFLPRFSQVAFLTQMPHMDVFEEVARMKGSSLTDADRQEVEERMQYANHWIAEYADEQHRFVLQDTVPASAGSLSDLQKQALRRLSEELAKIDFTDGQSIHEVTHQVKEGSGLSPQEFFSAVYTVFLDKQSGPKVGWFLSTLDKDLVVTRLGSV